MTPRWRDHYLDRHFLAFWRQRAQQPNVKVLLVLAVGFDPRCLRSLELLVQAGIPGGLNYIAFQLIAPSAIGASSDTMADLAKGNLERLSTLEGCRASALHQIETHDAEGHNVVGRKATTVLTSDRNILKAFSDIIIDVSGMPRGMFFPLLKYLLRQADAGVFANLHVAIVEDAVLDSRISAREYGQADYLHTFRFQGDMKVVWLPLIGRDELSRLQKIHNKIESKCIEICPILPFPASSLRRADDIILRHSDLLFESLAASPENIILSDERTPFDVYRKILDVDHYYKTRLGRLPEIGAVATVVSPLSSKTLSLGMALAAIESELPVCHVEAGAYQVELDHQGRLAIDESVEPTEIWLTGEPYDT